MAEPTPGFCPKCKRPTTPKNDADDEPRCVIEDSDQCRYAELLNLRETVARAAIRIDTHRGRTTSTHTYAILEVNITTLFDIERRLRAAGYDHCFDKDDDSNTIVDMTGVAIRASR